LSSPTTVLLKMNKISASKVVRAKWVNPETGEETIIGDFQNSGTRSFTTPQSQEDAVLLLDALL
jgi:Putative collagen-binding domain of a collagenase